MNIPFLKPKRGRRKKVRRMGNLSNYIELYIYILAALVLIGSVIVSLSR